MARFERWYLVVGLTACAAYLVLPRGHATEVLYTLIALSVPAVGAIALRRDRPRPLRAWATLTVGFGVVGVAELLFLTCITLGWQPGWSFPIDTLFVVGYVAELVGLLLIIQARTNGRSTASWLDAASVGIATFTVVWSSLYTQLLHQHAARPEFALQVVEPVVNVALVAMALRLVLGERRGYAVFGMLLAGYGLQTTADLLTSLLSGYVAGGRLDAMWAVAYILFGTSLLHRGRLVEPAQAPTVLARREFTQAMLLQGAVIVAVIATIGARAVRLVPGAILIIWLTAGAILLVVNRWRVFSLVKLIGEASVTENQRRLSALVDHSNEVIGFADREGVLRYVSSSIEQVSGMPASGWLGRDFLEILGGQYGMVEFVERVRGLEPGARAVWDSDVRPDTADGSRVVKVTVVNHTATPELGGWVITARDVTDEARLTDELRYQALHDTLTGLPNRALLFDRIEHALARVSRSPGEQLAVALVDLDEFKSVNDSLGHDTGDELLQGVAARLSAAVRPGDTVARLGGDEFALLLEDTTEAEAMAIAQRALAGLALPIQLGDVGFSANASIGVVCHRGNADPLELLRFADIAMYEAKREGKARVKLFREHMHHAARNQLELRLALSAALDHDELSLVYQPIIDTRFFRVCGVEALLRWRHPTRGAVPPSEFIPVAEQSGLLAPIGEWVLRKACAEAAQWPVEASDAYLSVNVSAAQISDRGFVAKVKSALRDSGLPAGRLLLEVTETMLVDDDALARDVLSELRQEGVRIAIDDFGTGYSSLAYLRQLSVDVVKIDQSFIRDLGTNSDHQALTRTMLALATGLSMTAIAEGVETETELLELQRLGCGFAQGFLFSYPIVPEDLRELLRNGATALLPVIGR